MLEWLAGWWNWPFILASLVGMGLVGITLVGAGHGDHHGGSHGHGHGLSHDLGALAVLGVGKAPLSVLVQVLLVSFGLIGLIVNAIARDALAISGGFAFPVAIGAAIVGSLTATGVVGQALARIAPANGPTSRKSGEFTGSMGVAVTSITHAIGQVNVVPGEPNAPAALLNVCLDPAWPAEIGRGTEVHLVAYDASKNLYTVRPLLTV